jgi:hypothetical protein
MPTDGRSNVDRAGVARAGPARILVGLVLTVAVVLASASIIADPASALTLRMAALYGGGGITPRDPVAAEPDRLAYALGAGMEPSTG